MDINNRIQEAEKKFNDLREQKRQIDEEMLRLQGEYRALVALRDEKPKVKESKKETK